MIQTKEFWGVSNIDKEINVFIAENKVEFIDLKVSTIQHPTDPDLIVVNAFLIYKVR